METNELDLIRQFRKHNDHQAFSRLFKPYAGRVGKWITGKGISTEDARDVMQEVLLGLADFLAREAPKNLAAVIYRITQRKVADFFQTANLKQTSLDQLMEKHQFDPPDPTNPLLPIEARHQLDKLLNVPRLSQEQKLTLFLHHYEGLSLQEVAELLKVPVNTVKSRLLSGKNRMKQFLAQRSGA